VTISPTLSFENGFFTVSGTASDDMSISRVSYQLSGASIGGGNASGTTSWSAGPFRPSKGRTYVTVTAFDASGNRGSATLTMDIVGIAIPGRRRAAPHELVPLKGDRNP
jgi:hypothetical protein